MIVINFKTYKASTGEAGLKLAKICEKAAKDSGKDIIIAVQEVDLFRIARLVTIPVYSEHLDPIQYGAHTGHNLPESLKQNGATGCILNHSEDRFNLDRIQKSIARAKEVGLKTIVCAATPELALAIAQFNPDFIAIEPPELIGGEVSVSTANPDIIKNTVDKVSNVPILCGAGVKDGKDVKIAMELGAVGVLVASHVIKAEKPEEILKELISGL